MAVESPTATAGGSPDGSRAAPPPARRAGWLRRHLGVIAIVVLALGSATVVQEIGWNQTSHYALVRSLSHGTAAIDQYRFTTGDKAFYRGHWYSARAPGLALITVLPYKVLSHTGVDQKIRQDLQGGKKTVRMIWLLGLWAALLPAVGAMLLVRWLGDRIAPGYGTAAGITLGIGTLFLPYSTLLFSHVFSAFLGFAAFALLWRERDRPQPDRLWLLALAGLLIGYGVATEYPLLFAGVVLGLYAISRGEVIRRGLAFAGGVLVGALPIAIYDKLAFGSFTHLAYADIPKQHAGFFGIRMPNPLTAVDLLFSSRGLLTLAPVLIMGIAGTVLLYRQGRRAEALVIAAVAAIYLVYNSGYYLPYGGRTPGPRFLITVLPFLCLPLALSYRRWPALTIGLAAVSATCMAVATIVEPFVSAEGDTGQWMRFLEHNDFQSTIVTVFGGPAGWRGAIPFFAAILLAAAIAAAASPRGRLAWRALGGAAVAAGTWALLAAFAPRILGIDHHAETRIVAAGDPNAVHEQYGSHPISHLAMAGLGVALLTLLAAAIVSRLGSRGGPAGARAAGTQPIRSEPASVA